MEQANLVSAMFQAVANTTELPKTGGKADGDFQKLLEKAQSGQPDSQIEERPKTQTTTKKTESSTAQKKEDPLARAKKLAEQGAWFTQPDDVWNVQIDFETGETIAMYQPGEYILAHLGGQTEVIPLTDLEPWERLQLQQLVTDLGQTIDVSDPEADAILEATAPGADNSPAAMLEKVVDEQIGQAAQNAVEEVQPQNKDDDQVELIDVDQEPQRVFQDVESVPVKVGEAENLEQTNETDVVGQVNDQIGQLIQSGESSVTVRLNPENLGEVTVEVSMKSDGVLNVAISARNDDTRALLERHSTQLQELVSSRTQQSVEVNVQRQQESQQNQNQQNYDGHNGHAQDGQERRRRQHESSNPQDFMQQLRLGLVPVDGE